MLSRRDATVTVVATIKYGTHSTHKQQQQGGGGAAGGNSGTAGGGGSGGTNVPPASLSTPRLVGMAKIRLDLLSRDLTLGSQGDDVAILQKNVLHVRTTG